MKNKIKKRAHARDKAGPVSPLLEQSHVCADERDESFSSNYIFHSDSSNFVPRGCNKRPLVNSRTPSNGNVSDDTIQEYPTNKQLSNEQIIDMMEKEQDAIVVKLMKDINRLREEVKTLQGGQSAQGLARLSASITFDRRPSLRADSLEKRKSKRKYSSDQASESSLDEASLLAENRRLRRENDLLRQRLIKLSLKVNSFTIPTATSPNELA